MPAYRVYSLDGAGKVWSAEWIEAEDDSTALEAARLMDGTASLEVWQNERLVGRVEAEPGSPEA